MVTALLVGCRYNMDASIVVMGMEEGRPVVGGGDVQEGEPKESPATSVTLMSEGQVRKELVKAYDQMRKDQATILELRQNQEKLAKGQIQGLIGTLGNEMVAAVKAMEESTHVFSTETLTTYTHLKFFASFE